MSKPKKTKASKKGAIEKCANNEYVFDKEDYMGLRPLPLYSMRLNNVSVPSSAKLSNDFTIKRVVNLSKIAVSALAVGTCLSGYGRL